MLKLYSYVSIAKKIFSFSFLFYFAENLYFGFNKTPQSPAESLCDNIVLLGLWVGVVLYLRPLAKIYEQSLKQK